MNLIIDIGNTRVKLAVFKGDSLLEQKVCFLDETIKHANELNEKYDLSRCILSSVVHLEFTFIQELNAILPVFELGERSEMLFMNQYKSPKTLGLDRIALVSAAVSLYPNKNCLVIDAGTCITFDFVSCKAHYFGGAISPGIQMRYNALADYTSKLPKLSIVDSVDLIGCTTEESIHSGVLNGVVNEIDGVIDAYKSDCEDLTVVLTGGDANFLSNQLKNSIFANQNFLLIGLNALLNHNIS